MEQELRLALRIVSGRIHVANLSLSQLYDLGFEANDLEHGMTDSEIIEAAEDILYDAITKSGNLSS